MANVFKNARGVVATSYNTIYTCPANTVAIIIGAQAANVDPSATTEVSMQWLDASASNAATRLAHQTSIPTASSLGLVSGQFVLEAGDSVQVSGSAAGKAEVTLGILEMT